MFTYLNNGPYEELQYRLHLKIYKYYFGGGSRSGAYSLNTDEYRMYHVYCVVSRCFRLYKVQDVLVYMPPTINYIYGLKKHLFMLISSTTTKSPNVARVGTGVTVKY